jgi:hypothetical protein
VSDTDNEPVANADRLREIIGHLAGITADPVPYQGGGWAVPSEERQRDADNAVRRRALRAVAEYFGIEFAEGPTLTRIAALEDSIQRLNGQFIVAQEVRP